MEIMNYPSLEIIKKQARVLQEFVKLEEGKKLSLSSCYNCLAKMWGFENWNQFSAILNKQEAEEKIIEELEA